MPAKLDYLLDLRANPRARTAEVQSRVKAATVNAVETAFRKYADAGLLESDNSAPKRYTLTDKGVEELKKLESEPAPANETGASLREQSSNPDADLISSIVKRAKEEGLCISVSVGPDAQTEAHEEETGKLNSHSARAKALLERAKALSEGREPQDAEPEDTHWDDPKVQRLYGLELGLSELPRRVVRDRKDALAAIVGSEVSDLVARLIQAEEELHSELEDSWWPDKQKRERFQQEIAELQRKLGCSEEDAEETQEARQPGPSDADRELLGGAKQDEEGL
jgi:hypothetical protein